MFKILHNILPKSSRLWRLNQKNSPACSLCPSGIPEDCLHALLVCSYNNDVNNFTSPLAGDDKITLYPKVLEVFSNIIISQES